jgi:cellulose synthase (UDP-forming)
MSSKVDDRLAPPEWEARTNSRRRAQVRLLVPINVVLAAWYFGWLLQRKRIGNAYVFALLVVAELFNLAQAAGYWWTINHRPKRRPRRLHDPCTRVDVFIPTYNEPLDIVEPTIEAALALHSADVEVWLLDDGDRAEMAEAARRLGARYLARPTNDGAKAGNLNYAIARTTAPFFAVFDCDHVPEPQFLERTLGHFSAPTVAYAQTPQYYANAKTNMLAAAAWSQQALFFGPICQGKDASDAIFCCGTNFVMRRSALEQVGGFPTNSITEDFLLSILFSEQGWSGVYVPEVLAKGLAPEDLSSYVNQQRRWATGCISTIPRVLRARTTFSHRLSTLLSATYFLSGWAILLNMLWPVIWAVTGAQPLAAVSADQFLLHFAPYFAVSLVTLGVASDGNYTWAAYSLACSNFAVQISSTLAAFRRRERPFVVTPKHGNDGLHLRAAAPSLIAASILAATAVLGLLEGLSPANINNVCFALLHVTVMAAGARHGLRLGRGRNPTRSVIRLDVAMRRASEALRVSEALVPGLGAVCVGGRSTIGREYAPATAAVSGTRRFDAASAAASRPTSSGAPVVRLRAALRDTEELLLHTETGPTQARLADGVSNREGMMA